MFTNKPRPLGIVGGLGPLASAEFLKTIYEYNIAEQEQSLPVVFMLSDPSFPDRTEALLNNSPWLLLDRLVGILHKLSDLDVSHVVICCVTIHKLLPQLSGELRRNVISLIDVILAEVIERRRNQLLICTLGSRKLKIYQDHALWREAQKFIVWPDESDQQTVHGMIYRIKRGESVDSLAPAFRSLLLKYRVDSFIAGCTEIHLLSKLMISAKPRPLDCIDPLISIAKNLKRLSGYCGMALLHETE